MNAFAGPANESGQTLSLFSVTSTNPGLFQCSAFIDLGGTLSFTPAANANGSSTVTVVLKDNAGTANGGSDTLTV